MFGLIEVESVSKKKFIKDFTTKEQLKDFVKKNCITNYMIKDYELLKKTRARARKENPNRFVEVKR